jgi:hypothetical protein
VAGAAHLHFVTIVALLTCGLVTPQDSRRPPASYSEVRLDAIQEIMPKLSSLSAWCSEQKLFRERDRLDALVLVLDPENQRARTALRYRKQKDGSWIRSADWKEARNTSDKPLAEYAKRRAEEIDPAAMRLFEALQREQLADPKVKASRLLEVLQIAPDHPKIRDALGERRLGDKWVLAETAAAAERRREIARIVQSIRATPRKIDEGRPTEFEDELDLPITRICQTIGVRVAATVMPAEAEAVLKECDIAWQLMHLLAGVESDPLTRPTVLLLHNAELVRKCIAAHPETPEEHRSSLFADYSLGDAGLIILGWEKPAARMDHGIFRMAAQGMTVALKSGLFPGWALEGIGMYTAFAVAGRRAPKFGMLNTAAPESTRVLDLVSEPQADWNAIAALYVSEGKAPALEAVMSRRLFDLSPLDSLFASTFMAYLLEGRPAEACAFIRSATFGVSPSKLAMDAWKLDLATVESRFHRWLGETAAPPSPKRPK